MHVIFLRYKQAHELRYSEERGKRWNFSSSLSSLLLWLSPSLTFDYNWFFAWVCYQTLQHRGKGNFFTLFRCSAEPAGLFTVFSHISVIAAVSCPSCASAVFVFAVVAYERKGKLIRIFCSMIIWKSILQYLFGKAYQSKKQLLFLNRVVRKLNKSH